MTTKTNTIEAVKQISYLAGALKAPRISDAATRLADQARDAGCSNGPRRRRSFVTSLRMLAIMRAVSDRRTTSPAWMTS